MKIIGLTGGIGSGKTTAAYMFKDLGIPIYIADEEAKQLLVRSKVIRRKLIALFGEKVYLKNGGINKKFISDKIFKNSDYLEKMNAIVHPKVAQHFKRWIKKQDAPFVLKESAILFESGAYKECDKIITVTASEDIRINRVLKRDHTTKKRVKAIIDKQLPEEYKIKNADYVIYNNTLEETLQAVKKIYADLIKR